MQEKTVTLEEVFNFMRNGEQDKGVELLYLYHYNKLYGIAFSIVKKESVSEDAVSNALYKLLKLEREKLPKAYEASWLYTFVKNETLMLLRKEKTVVSFEEIGATIAVEDKKIQDYIDMDAYESMTKGLNEEQNQIVALKVLGGYTHKEISKMLGKPIGTVQWIYNRSIKKLKRILSSLMTGIILSGIGFAVRLVAYIQKGGNTGAEMNPERPAIGANVDFLTILFGVIFLTGVVVSVFVYKKSDKIPTKANKKRI